MSAAKGQQPSVLMFAVEDSLKGSSMASIWGHSSKMVPLMCSASWMDEEGVATFALGSSNGTIYCLRMPPPGTNRGFGVGHTHTHTHTHTPCE